MRRLVILLAVTLLPLGAAAQDAMDRNLRSMVDAVSALRGADEKSYERVRASLSEMYFWTPMNETGPLREGECAPSDRVQGFRLNRLLNQIAGTRKYVSAHGYMLNGEDQRYCYSLYERSVKAGRTVTYTLREREGEQVLVIVTGNPAAGAVSATARVSGGKDVAFREEGNGVLTARLDCSASSVLTVSVTGGAANQAFVLLNYNSRSGAGAGEAVEDPFRRKMREIVSEGNRRYDLGDRRGIRAMYDSLRVELARRSREGHLDPADSLEFTADSYKLLADWLYERSFYDDNDAAALDSAERHFNLAIETYLKGGTLFSRDLDKIPLIRREQAQLYYRMGTYEKTRECLAEAESAFREAYDERVFSKKDPLYFDWQDILMQEALCQARLGQYAAAEKRADEVLSRLPRSGERYYESLRRKAKIILLSGREKSAAPLYRSFFQWKREDALASLKGLRPSGRQDYWMRMRPFVTDCYALEGEDPGLLFDVSLFSKGILLQMGLFDRSPEALGTLSLTWEDIQRALPQDGCAVEYLQYEKAGEKRLAAVVVRKTGSPVWVPLMSPDAFLSYPVKGMPVRELLRAGARIAQKNSLFEDGSLREQLWPEALRRAIGDARRVYFSPDGYIHLTAVEYMLPEELSGKELYRLSSCRQIAVKRSIRLDSALILGGIPYRNKLSSQPGGNDAAAFRSWAGYYFDELKNSAEEAGKVYAIRSKSGDSLLVGEGATEAAARALLGRYDLVHLATHGAYKGAGVPLGTDLKPCLTDESLSESVLLLSGASWNLRSRRFDPSHQDGLLSAKEISALDLRKTSLVVASACESSLGSLTSDGVYGLQRGFKSAGAGAMVLSLWNVSDLGTYYQMTRFHEALREGKDIHTAFSAARDAWEKDTEHPQLNIPYIKNAFILIDAL